MDTALASINQHKENFFDFEMNVDGLSAEDADVRFVIKFKPDMVLSFPCEHASGSKWTVDLPAIPMLETTAYNFVIEVIIDGYYFEPFRGLLNVVGTPEVYVSKPEKSSTKDERREKLSVEPLGGGDRTKGREKGIEQLARETMQKAEKKVEKKADKKETVEETPKRVAIPEPKESAVDVDAVVENLKRGKKKAEQDETDRLAEEARLEEKEATEKAERLSEEVRVREETEAKDKQKKKEETDRLDKLVEKAAGEVDAKPEVVEEDNKLLDKPTPTVEELAKKHKVPVADIRKQLTMGIKAEKEHTSDVKVAREIALDHLNELPDYYDRLEKIEEVVIPKPVVDPKKDGKVKDVLKELAAVEPVVEPEPEVIEEVVDPVDPAKDSKVLEAVRASKSTPKKKKVTAKKVTAKKVQAEPVVEAKETEKDKAVKDIVTEAKKPAQKKRKVAKKKPAKKKPVVVEKVDTEKSDKAKKILEEEKTDKPAKKKTKKKLPVKKGDQVTRRRRVKRKS